MSHEQEFPVELIVAIDACRPGSDDDCLPEVAAVLEHESAARVAEFRRSIERIDRAVTAATRQVPVPEGLADRILGRLRTESAESLGRPADAAVEVPSPQQAQLGARRWRRLTAASAGLAMAASLLIGLFLRASRERIDLVETQAQARAFYVDDNHRAALSSDEFPTSLPVATDTVRGWRKVTFLNRPGLAYELGSRRGVVGTLYVVSLRSLWGPTLTGLPTAPTPQGTSGTTVAVWTAGGNVYIVVVKGDERDFWSFFSHKVA